MKVKAFFDTNILAYAFDQRSPEKRKKAKDLIALWMPSGDMVISTQVLQELFVVLTRKFAPAISLDNAKKVPETFSPVETIKIDREKIFKAIEIVKESSISFWDGLIVSAAVFARCKVIFTEDLNSGEVIAGVKVENPL